MKRFLVVLLFIPSLVLTQGNKDQGEKQKSQLIPIQAQYSDSFDIKNVHFNRNVDLFGKGEVLDVLFELHNKTDDPMDLYVFVIATYEKTEKTTSSFEMPVPEKDRLRSFVPFPFNMDNFLYPAVDAKGNPVKDAQGKAKMVYHKYPVDPKQGINPTTGQLYHLDKKLVIRTNHLSKYRTNYFFFNNVVILIFNKEGQPQYKQSYLLTSFRR